MRSEEPSGAPAKHSRATKNDKMSTSNALPSAISGMTRAFPRLGARRQLVLGGLALFLAGTILGDVFAVFILHPNADRIGQALTAATAAVRQHRPEEAGRSFEAIGGFLENRGTKVDAHAHMIGFGYLAMLLAML